MLFQWQKVQNVKGYFVQWSVISTIQMKRIQDSMENPRYIILVRQLVEMVEVDYVL